jgi:hypothetical protein
MDNGRPASQSITRLRFFGQLRTLFFVHGTKNGIDNLPTTKLKMAQEIALARLVGRLRVYSIPRN